MEYRCSSTGHHWHDKMFKLSILYMVCHACNVFTVHPDFTKSSFYIDYMKDFRISNTVKTFSSFQNCDRVSFCDCVKHFMNDQGFQLITLLHKNNCAPYGNILLPIFLYSRNLSMISGHFLLRQTLTWLVMRQPRSFLNLNCMVS